MQVDRVASRRQLESGIGWFEDPIALDYGQGLVEDKYVWEDKLEVAELLKWDVTAEHELDLVILKNSADIDSLSIALRGDLFSHKVAHDLHFGGKRKIVFSLVDEVTL